MKKTSKLFVGLALSGMLMTGCNFGVNKSLNETADKQLEIYNLYAAEGGELTYEQWLETIRGAAFLAGAADPAATDGQNGDIYVNTSTWDFFLKIGGAWSKLGCLKGAEGPEGKQGAQGNPGPAGPQGPAGQDGAAGNSFYSERGLPAAEFGKDGDTYMNLNNFDIFVKRDGQWVKEANLTHDIHWAGAIKEMMLHYVGEEVPFVNFDTETLKYGYNTNYGCFYMYDSDNENILEDYGEELLFAGWEEVYDFDEDFTYYEKVTSRGIKVEAVPSYFEDDGTNQLAFYAPEVYSEEYFTTKLGMAAVEAYPADHVNEALDDEIAGANLEGAWLEKYTKRESTDTYYIVEFLATQANVADELIAQIEAIGYAKKEGRNFYVKEGSTAEVTVDYHDGWTFFKILGDDLPYPDFTEEEIIEKYKVEKVEGWPEDVITSAFFEDNRFAGANVEGDWYFSSSKSTYSDETFRQVGYLITKGDYTEAMIENFTEADFVYNYGYYEQEEDDYTYTSIRFNRGWTIIYYSGDRQTPDLPDYTEAELAEKGYEKVSGYPAALVDEALGEQNAIAGVNLEADWFQSFKKKTGATEDGMTAYYISASIATAGDVREAYAANLVEAGFALTDAGSYRKAYGEDFAQVSMSVVRGFTFINITGPWIETDVPFDPMAEAVAEFPMNDINEFLAAYGLGFAFEEALPDPAGAGYVLTFDYYYDIVPYADIYLSGNCVEAVEAAMLPLLTAAGFAYDDDEEAYLNSNYDTVGFFYDSDYNVTVVDIMVWSVLYA